MNKKGSVSPKERVNIVYRSEVGDSKEEVELPLKVLVLGDFTFKEDGSPMEDREIIDVNKNNFDEILSSQELSLDLTVPDHLSGKKNSSVDINLSFNSIKDFNPDNIIEQVPALQKIIELRKSILALKGPLGNIPTFRRQIQELLEDDKQREKLKKELSL